MNNIGFPFLNQNSMNQQYQTLYNQTNLLKKDYDVTTDTEMKSALKIVLNKKITELETINSVYNSTINSQIKSLVPK